MFKVDYYTCIVMKILFVPIPSIFRKDHQEFALI